MNKFQIVLAAGRAQSGKDTFALRFTESHGFLRGGFADFPKDICTNLLDSMGCKIERWYFDDPAMKERVVINLDGDMFQFSAGGKREYILTYRQFLRKFMIESCRDVIHESIWALPLISRITKIINTNVYNGIIVPDFRFESEYQEIDRFAIRYGTLIELTTVNIIRPDNAQPDQGYLKDFKFTIGIKNDGTVADLFKKADDVATGKWKHTRLQEKARERAGKGFLSKYKLDDSGKLKDKADEHGIIQHDS